MDFQEIAAQLRQPHGELGKQVGERMNASNALINAQAIEALAIGRGDTVLEIGMGNGIFCKDILRTSAVEYTGCDFSELMVAEAIRLNEVFVASGQAMFVQADARQLPFEDARFDKIFTVNTVYFWEHPAEVLREIYRVLKPAGTFVIGLRSKESMESLPFTKYGFKMYEKQDVQQLLERNHFVNNTVHEYKEPLEELYGKEIQMVNLIAIGQKS